MNLAPSSCPACGQPVPALARLRRLAHCGRAECAQKIEREGSGPRRQAAETRAADRVQRRLKASGRPTDAWAIVWLAPHDPPRLRATTSAERAAFAQHLLACASGDTPATAVVADPQWDEAPAAGTPPLPETEPRVQGGQLCAGCGGRCCRPGLASHAFVTSRLLERWVERHPGSAPAHAVQAYLERVPARHVGGSCLFHTDLGCALPRQERSAVCNRFECAGLQEANAELVRQPDAALIALVGINGRVQRGFWAGPDGRRHQLRTER
jgi:hypothetical protein